METKKLCNNICSQELDQLDNKEKSGVDQNEKGETSVEDPMETTFLSSDLAKLYALWTDAINLGESRLQKLRGVKYCYERLPISFLIIQNMNIFPYFSVS